MHSRPLLHRLSRKVTKAESSEATISLEQALAEFDRVVGLAASGANDDAQKILEDKSAADLRVIAKELGVSFPKSKPSIKAVREAIFGKVRESVLLSTHNRRTWHSGAASAALLLISRHKRRRSEQLSRLPPGFAGCGDCGQVDGTNPLP
jgi:hypothetical protein